MAEKINCEVFLSPALQLLARPMLSPELNAFSVIRECLRMPSSLRGCLGVSLYPWVQEHR